jgi:CRP-like cAMP-binding protein
MGFTPMLHSLTLCNDAFMETSNKITGEHIMANVMNAFCTDTEQAAAKRAATPVARKKSEGKPAQPRPSAVAPVRITALYGHNPRQNQLLAALPDEDFERILPHLEFISMPFDMTVCEADTQMNHVYFLTSSIVSLLYETRDGASAEIAVIGNEGIVGVTLFMGGGASPNRAVVKSAGYGFRLKASVFMEEFRRGGALQQSLLRYTNALIAQMSHTAVCNRHHNVMQQLCRWLLLTLDRLPSNEMAVSQGLIATMLGVRRESVTEAAGKLQDEGMIQYRRGHITVMDRAGLETRACECYAGVKKEYDRLKCSHARQK